MALLVIDLDGTLLGRDGRVSPGNAAALRRAGDAGLEIVLATGRSWRESRHAIAAAGDRGLFIGAGGSVINDAATGRALHRAVIDPALVVEMAHTLVEHGHLAHLLKDHNESDHDYVFVGHHPMHSATEWWLREHDVSRVHAPLLRSDEHRALANETIRVGTTSQKDKLAPAAKAIGDQFGDVISFQHWGALTETETIGSLTHLLEIFARGVDKWSAAQWICRRRDVDPGDVIAIGDGLNDLPMISGAGFGIAMGNADSRVRDAADAVVGGHHEDGAAEAIDLAVRHHTRGTGSSPSVQSSA